MTMPTNRYGRVVAAVFGVLFAALVALAALALFSVASAAPAIPAQSVLYRLQLQREVARRFGLGGGNVALIAAQIHAESAWRTTAASAYAQGLAQFTPPTAKWLPDVCPDIGAPDPWDAQWSIRAIVCYDAWLYARNRGATACDRWAFTASDYNGGGKWRMREQDLARASGADPLRWFAHVERFRARSIEAWTENRAYVQRILQVLTPRYVAAGWPGARLCT